MNKQPLKKELSFLPTALNDLIEFWKIFIK